MKHILLLEEDAEARQALSRLLKRKGFLVQQAENEVHALNIAATRPIDIVIAGATEKDRSEFFADLRETAPLVPVVFLSDYCSPEARLRGMCFGPFSMSRSLNFYLNVRPVALLELVRLIRLIPGASRQARRISRSAA